MSAPRFVRTNDFTMIIQTIVDLTTIVVVYLITVLTVSIVIITISILIIISTISIIITGTILIVIIVLNSIIIIVINYKFVYTEDAASWTIPKIGAKKRHNYQPNHSDDDNFRSRNSAPGQSEVRPVQQVNLSGNEGAPPQ